MNKDTPFLDGKPVKPSDSTIPVFGSTKPNKPTLKTEKETTGTAKISGTGKPLTAGAVSPTNCPLENKDAKVKEPVKKCEGESCETKNESTTFKFDRIWRELTEADDTLPIGGETDASDANLEGDAFDDDSGDLNPMDNTEDEEDTEVGAGAGSAEDILRSIRDQINDFLGEGVGDEDELLDTDETELDTDVGGEEGATGEELPPEPTQNESWQRKTAFGPKMSDKAPGKLGKKKGGKMGKGTLKKNIVDGKGKKVPLSKFNPKMSDKVSRLTKGDLF